MSNENHVTAVLCAKDSKLDHGYCAVELPSSSELLYFTEADVVNLLDK